MWAFNIRKPTDENGVAIEPSTEALPGFLLTPVKFACHFEPRSEGHAKIIELGWANAQEEGLVWGRDRLAKEVEAH